VLLTAFFIVKLGLKVKTLCCGMSFSTGLGIAAFALTLGSNAKSTEATNLYLFTRFERGFDNLEHCLHQINGVLFREAGSLADSGRDFSLGHRSPPSSKKSALAAQTVRYSNPIFFITALLM
jgi:hypothetical protein